MNVATIGDSYKLPRKEYILEKIKGNTHFSTFDAKSGYWQLRLHENMKPLTTFHVLLKSIMNGMSFHSV